MRFNGEWSECDDGVIRPCIQGKFCAPDGELLEVTFLLDGGADRTVFNAEFLDVLRPFEIPQDQSSPLEGVGGKVGSIKVDTAILFKNDLGRLIPVRGSFHVFTEYESSDLSVLGRDVTNNFRVVYDYLDQTVILLSPPHRYEIKTA